MEVFLIVLVVCAAGVLVVVSRKRAMASVINEPQIADVAPLVLPPSLQHEEKRVSKEAAGANVLEDVSLLRQRIAKRDQAINDAIRPHLPVLVRKYEQLTYKDDYGDWVFDAWDHELAGFIGRKLAHFSPGMKRDDRRWIEMDRRVMDAIHAYEKERGEDTLDLDDVTDPLEYERMVALTLETLGWEARTTVASGDQGADVVASKDGIRLVVQCKLLGQPVGNKAVQEVFAAKRHQRADLAVVVSNAGYTKSARQLASTTHVFLLHHDELAAFDESQFSDEQDDTEG